MKMRRKLYINIEYREVTAVHFLLEHSCGFFFGGFLIEQFD